LGAEGRRGRGIVWPMPARTRTYEALIFDFDGTLVDSDEELVRAFIVLGVDPSEITFGHAIAEEVDRLGLSLEGYADAYRDDVVQPFAGVADTVPLLGRWALCSNKHPRSGIAELARLGWDPEVAVFSDHFDWAHKRLQPVLEMMDLRADQVAMVGDSGGDARCAAEIGCDMVWAGWNPRVAAAAPDGIVLQRPEELLGLY
jgi:phosphoglycolate phosphatase-like HAD superfamily hydrolase